MNVWWVIDSRRELLTNTEGKSNSGNRLRLEEVSVEVLIDDDLLNAIDMVDILRSTES